MHEGVFLFDWCKYVVVSISRMLHAKYYVSIGNVFSTQCGTIKLPRERRA